MYKEELKVVDELNEWIGDCSTGDTFGKAFTFSFRTDGFVTYIEFNDHILWSDDNDEREYIESEDKYEDLEEYIKARFISLCAKYWGSFDARLH